jgi:hypothetical protein
MSTEPAAWKAVDKTPPERITNAALTSVVVLSKTTAHSTTVCPASRLRLERPDKQVFEIGFAYVPPHPPRRIFFAVAISVFIGLARQ